MCFLFFFFYDTPTTEIYTLSLHDALPISGLRRRVSGADLALCAGQPSSLLGAGEPREDRKSTRLNSSHVRISYAVFCLKKKTGRQVTSLVRGPVRIPPTDAHFVF